MAWEFNRHVEDKLIESLVKTDLWQEKLKEDCEKGEVFLAIRNGYISFYYKGGGLFNFDINGFSTHVKYASVVDINDENAKKNYIYEDQLGKNMPLIKNFISGYAQIKNNCKLHSGEEAIGVSDLLKKSTYLLSKESYLVIDIEIAFMDSNKKQDRIDILLYDTVSQTLRFVEAKHFTNKEIWSKSIPPVIGQLKKYEDQIELFKKDIIDEYSRYFGCIKRIFNLQLPVPRKIDKKVSLVIFGFDEAQKLGDRFKELILGKPEYKGIPIYPIGNPKDLKAESIWKRAQ